MCPRSAAAGRRRPHAALMSALINYRVRRGTHSSTGEHFISFRLKREFDSWRKDSTNTAGLAAGSGWVRLFSEFV